MSQDMLFKDTLVKLLPLRQILCDHFIGQMDVYPWPVRPMLLKFVLRLLTSSESMYIYDVGWQENIDSQAQRGRRVIWICCYELSLSIRSFPTYKDVRFMMPFTSMWGEDIIIAEGMMQEHPPLCHYEWLPLAFACHHHNL